MKEKKKPIVYYSPAWRHKMLKQEAIDQECTMGDIINWALDVFFDVRAKAKGAKYPPDDIMPDEELI